MISPVSARSPGRPRNSGEPAGADVRDALLAAAARLFAAQGYANTSTREIAAAVGLRQPSLFHYFASKDLILDAILVQLMAPSLAQFAALKAVPAAADVRLFAALFADARQVALRIDAARALMRMPELASPHFAALGAARATLFSSYAGMIEAGQAAGLLRPGPAALFAQLAISQVEALGDPWSEACDPDRYAAVVADMVMRGLLAEPARLSGVQVDATAVLAHLDAG